MYREEISNYMDQHQDQLLDLICTLVRIPSEKSEPLPNKPYGEQPAKALEKALEIANEMGFSTRNYQNYVGTVDLNQHEKVLDILAHLDVVPAPPEDWTITTPFEPVIQNGKIYGRGSSDDKGPAMAALMAMKTVKDLNIPLTKNVRLILGTDEECGSSDIEHYYAQEPEAPMTFSPDGSFPVINTEKGRYTAVLFSSWDKDQPLPRVLSVDAGVKLNVIPDKASAQVQGLCAQQIEEIAKPVTMKTKVSFTTEVNEEANSVVIRARGVGGHAAYPEHANNALTGLLELLAALPLAQSESTQKVQALRELFPHGDWLGKGAGISMEDEVSGPLTLSLNMIHWDADSLEAMGDCRVCVCGNETNVKEVLSKKVHQVGLNLEDRAMIPPHHVPADTPFIQTLLKVYEEYTGLCGECFSTGGGTYVHDLKNGVSFGASMPGTENHEHGADESAEISDLLMSAKIFAQVIVDLCS